FAKTLMPAGRPPARRHHFGTPGDIISESAGDFVGICSLLAPRRRFVGSDQGLHRHGAALHAPTQGFARSPGLRPTASHWIRSKETSRSGSRGVTFTARQNITSSGWKAAIAMLIRRALTKGRSGRTDGTTSRVAAKPAKPTRTAAVKPVSNR